MEVSIRIVTVFFCVLNTFKGIHCILDITCLTEVTRIRVNGDAGFFIGGYKSGADLDAAVSFSRVLRTYGTQSNPQSLPSGSYERNHPALGSEVQLLQMPTEGGGRRVGAYYCNATKGDTTESITTTVMSKHSVFTPSSLSYTASLGDTLVMVVNVNEGIDQFRWRRNGHLIHEWDNRTEVTIENVDVHDSGIYECHEKSVRRAEHAIFQVVVRGCASNKWGPPSCDDDCPICLNGGICDDRSGVCVCAPSFTGRNCEEVLGSNRWGQDGGRRCTSTQDANGTACEYSLFCLPHPYGCSCAAGFQGIDCDQQCTGTSGLFGAGCKQECHCAPDVSCWYDTGECAGGQCAEGWSGVNCQQRCTEPGEIPGITMMSNENVLQIDWEPERSICLDKQYIIEYELLQIFHCELTNVTIMEERIASTSINITVLHNANYTVYIKAQMNGTYTSERQFGRTIKTDQGAPTAPPEEVTASVQAKSIAFQWTEPPCGHRHGPINSYLYFLQDETGDVISNSTTQDTTVTLSDLMPYTVYNFTIAASTDVGIGPFVTMTTKTLESGSSMPKSLRVTGKTINSISVSWSSPESPNGVIIQYMVESRVIGKSYDPTFVADKNVEPDIVKRVDVDMPLMCNITNLIPSTEYEISVLAINGAGLGEPSRIKESTKPATIDGSDLYIIVIVVLVIVLLAVVAAFVIKTKCMRSNNTPSASTNQTSTNPTAPTMSMPSETSPDKPIQMSTGDYVEYKPQEEGEYQDLNTGMASRTSPDKPIQMSTGGYVGYKPHEEGQYENLNTGPVAPKYYEHVVDVASPVIGSNKNPGEDYDDANTYEEPK